MKTELLKYMKELINNNSANTITVISSPPGSHKTSAMIDYCAENYLKGIILVIERLNDAEIIKERIDKLANNKIAFILYGFNKKFCKNDRKEMFITDDGNDSRYVCSDCEHIDCKAHSSVKYNQAKKYPVIIITHKRLEFYQVQNKGLSRIKHWNNGTRGIMFIDEKPSLVDLDYISLKKLNFILSESHR